ncbi:acyl-CoA dehydrogenase family protein [Streptomyces sp. TG1A-8]|uniref:acyl-CoA dehydrogenase family protein n=1 Tax=Streptomyces sp. TG1A-8 TaxID=3051385 RepID=UPI00265C2CAC|nr:acyl-CoA dehydrogenase family protein [Streptomyces sp. TG1A-8]MDO0926660.1 acyl-CoA dehydrogenase family protein [Streptomyces sp. TG1A-8]
MLIPADTAPARPRTGTPDGADTAEGAVRERITALERFLGDPADDTNPFGRRALLDADARGEPLPAADAVPAGFGLGAEVVPAALGGRLERTDGLVRVLRALFRRSASLGVGHGVGPLLAALPVWASGTARQRRWTADLLLGGGTLAVAPREPDHGDRFAHGGFTAVPGRDGLLLDGRGPAVVGAARAGGLVVHARTFGGDGARGHGVLLLDTASLPADRFTVRPRHRAAGLRSCGVAGVEARACPVPSGALVGSAGEGAALAVRSNLFAQASVPGMVLGGGDTALRTAVWHAVGRAPGGDAAALSPQQRTVLARVFANLLVCDCLTLVAGRALHLLPARAALPAAVTGYVVPRLLRDSAYDLSTVLGARFHCDEGAYGVFRGYLRDLPLTGAGHVGGTASQSALVPQLPQAARRPWSRADAPPWDLFAVGGGLPALDVGRAVPRAGADPSAAALVSVARLLGAADGHRGGSRTGLLLRELVQGLAGELERLRARLRAVPGGGTTVLADPRVQALADRYALVSAGGACLGVWYRQRDAPGSFLAEPAWLVEALVGLAHRLGLPLPGRGVPTAEPVVREVLDRYHSARSYDLYGDRLYADGL